MGIFHQWWLCNSGGCGRVVYSESGAGADLQSQSSSSMGLFSISEAVVSSTLGMRPSFYVSSSS
jgi:hypothetical protein